MNKKTLFNLCSQHITRKFSFFLTRKWTNYQQVTEEKTTTEEKKESATADPANKESAPAVETTGDVKVAENESVANKPVGVVANGC